MNVSVLDDIRLIIEVDERVPQQRAVDGQRDRQQRETRDNRERTASTHRLTFWKFDEVCQADALPPGLTGPQQNHVS
jgi:hypothetical protein